MSIGSVVYSDPVIAPSLLNQSVEPQAAEMKSALERKHADEVKKVIDDSLVGINSLQDAVYVALCVCIRWLLAHTVVQQT